MASGSSGASDSRVAGAQACADAVQGRSDARLLVVFASDAHDLAALSAGIAGVAGDVPVIGCSTAGEIAQSGPGDAGVVVMGLGGPGFSVATTCASAADVGLLQAGAAVAECAEQVRDSPHRTLLLLSDGLAGDQEELVRGAYRVLGAEVPLVGGCAGDDLRMSRTRQLFDG